MIRIAMLGAGRIGNIHARNVAANPRCRLVAVADPIAESARSLAESLSADLDGCGGDPRPPRIVPSSSARPPTPMSI